MAGYYCNVRHCGPQWVMKKASEYVKIPRRVLEEVLREASAIENRQKAEHLTDSASAYAYAMGQSSGCAINIKCQLEGYLKEGK